jgi:hypothetical protein
MNQYYDILLVEEESDILDVLKQVVEFKGSEVMFNIPQKKRRERDSNPLFHREGLFLSYKEQHAAASFKVFVSGFCQISVCSLVMNIVCSYKWKKFTEGKFLEACLS